MNTTRIDVTNARYHRNGSAGAGFYVLHFTLYPGADWEDREPRLLQAVVFDEPGHVAVTSAHPRECWRCEDFEPLLRAHIASPDCQRRAFEGGTGAGSPAVERELERRSESFGALDSAAGSAKLYIPWIGLPPPAGKVLVPARQTWPTPELAIACGGGHAAIEVEDIADPRIDVLGRQRVLGQRAFNLREVQSLRANTLEGQG